MSPPAKTFQYQLPVRAYEIDSFGHVNHSVFFNYLEVARWEMLREVGITLKSFQTWKRWPVIAEAQIKYLKPVLMGDTLEIRTTIPEHGRVHFKIRQEIFRDGLPIAQAELQSVTVDENGRPSAMPPEFHRLWEGAR